MADDWAAADKTNTDAKRRALEALAKGGSDELRAFQRAQQALAADRQRTIQSAMEDAVAIRAEDAGAALQPIVEAPFDRRATYLKDQAASTAALGNIVGQANSNYFSQVAAAKPFLAAFAEAQRQKRMEEEGMDDILRRLGGVGVVEGLITAQAQKRNPGDVRHEYGPAMDNRFDEKTGKMTNKPAAPGTFNFRGDLEPRNATMEETASDVAEELGLPKEFGPALLKEQKKAKPTQAAHRISVIERVQRHASPGTVDAFERTVAKAGSLAKALDLLKETPEKDLRKNGVSPAVLRRWLTDYYRV